MNLISEYIDPYTLIKFIDHNADRSGLPLLVKKRLKLQLTCAYIATQNIPGIKTNKAVTVLPCHWAPGTYRTYVTGV